jgi:hypothetical protein
MPCRPMPSSTGPRPEIACRGTGTRCQHDRAQPHPSVVSGGGRVAAAVPPAKRTWGGRRLQRCPRADCPRLPDSSPSSVRSSPVFGAGAEYILVRSPRALLRGIEGQTCGGVQDRAGREYRMPAVGVEQDAGDQSLRWPGHRHGGGTVGLLGRPPRHVRVLLKCPGAGEATGPSVGWPGRSRARVPRPG